MGKHDQIFHANKELSNILIDIWCFDAWLLLFVSFAYLFSYSKRLDLTGNFLSLHHLSLFKTCQTLWPLKNILFQSFTLFCQTLELRLPQDDTNQFKIKLNEHVRWKKFPFDNFLIEHLNEFRRVNNLTPVTGNICLGHAIHHTLLSFILQSLLNTFRLFLI